MTGPELGFLLLTGQLGNPERKPLTVAQMRVLATRVSGAKIDNPDREMTVQDLIDLGYGEEMAKRILDLLEETELLRNYLRKGLQKDCVPLTRISPGYPAAVQEKLGLDSPGCLWCLGDVSLLDTRKIALVGSRALERENTQFAREVGQQAALQGYTLVSGNAVGADHEAQQACLDAGGSVISVVAFPLEQHKRKDRVLYLAEDDYDQPFSAQRALSRNRIIHCLGEKTFVAQCSLEKGGSWDGSVRNLRFSWSPLYGFRDGSEAMNRLERMGMCLILQEDLKSFPDLPGQNQNLFHQ